MEKTKNTTRARLTQIFLAATIIFFAVFVFQKNTKAEIGAIFDCDEYLKNQSAANFSCDQLIGEKKDQCKEQDKKMKAYCDLVEIKSKQGNTYQRLLDLINLEQSKNQTDITLIRQKSEDLNKQISDLEIQIVAKENLLKYQKSILSGLMQSYYEDYQEGVLNIVLINKNFSDILNQSDYVGQASARLKDVLVTIGAVKIDLEKEQNLMVEAKRENEDLKNQLQDKKKDLESNEFQKQSLLSKTAGEEAKYRDLLARVEEQKLELFNFGASGNAADVLATVGQYPKPDKKYWASTNPDWYFSQRDSRWGGKTIGNSGSLMKDWGCAVAAVAMVFKYYGASIDPGKLAKEPIFYYDLIRWPDSWSPDIDLASGTAHTSINWSKVDSSLKNKQPVIVYIKKTNGGGGHYVVIHNKDSRDYVVHDPYFGSNLYLGTTKALMGAMNPAGGTVVEQAIIYN